MDISGDVAIVGSNGSGNAVAVLYQYDGSGWIETTMLSQTDARINAFGSSVAVSGEAAIVGAPSSVINDFSSAGATFIDRFDGRQWLQESKLTPTDGGDFERFGTDVDVTNSVAIVGAPFDA